MAKKLFCTCSSTLIWLCRSTSGWDGHVPFSARSTLFVYVNVEVSLYRTEGFTFGRHYEKTRPSDVLYHVINVFA